MDVYNPIHANLWVAYIHMFFHHLQCDGCIITHWYTSAERIQTARHTCTSCGKLFWMHPGFIWDQRYIRGLTVHEPKTLWQLVASSWLVSWLRETKAAIEAWKAKVEAEVEDNQIAVAHHRR
jgi:hypothetical protein